MNSRPNLMPVETGPDREYDLLPHNVELEQAVLGAIMLNNAAMATVGEILRPEHFSEPLHQKIFDLCSSLTRAGKVASPLTLKTFLPADLDIGGMTAARYLARLCAEATTVINAGDYARSIADLATRRELIRLADDIRTAALNTPADASPASQIEAIEQRLFELADAGHPNRMDRPLWVGEAIAEAVDAIAGAYQNDGRLLGITWGVPSIDTLTQGLHKGEVTILAARPSMGKSAVATSAGRAAARSGVGTALFSLEMSAEALGLRLLSEALSSDGAAMPYFRLRSGRIGTDEFDRIVDHARTFESLPFIIDQRPALTIAQLSSRVRRCEQRLKQQGKKLELVIVDYMQLMQSGERYRGQRVHEVTEVSAGLKRIAREESVAVLALSQLSRKVEEREDKRPILSDLRDSGSIEQDADTVIFLFREEYYLRNREPRAGSEEHFAWQTKMEAAHGRLDVIVAKQRHGPTDTVTVSFDAATNVVRDLASEERLPERGMAF